MFIKVKSMLSELQQSDSSLIITNYDSEMANILNDYFVTVFVTEYTMNMPSLGDICSGNCLAEIIIFNDMFEINCYHSIHPTESSGPEECHPHVLREVKKSIVTELYLIF